MLHKMKTRSNVDICPTCFYRLQTYGYPCSSMMDLALGHYVQNRPLIFTETADEKLLQIPLQYLEKKGFLISTEISEFRIQILPNMLKNGQSSPNSPNDSGPQERRFCWC